MTYIENIFLCMVSPLLVAALCMGRRQLRFFLLCIAGMGVCLLSAYINTFLAAVCQADALAATAEIAPVMEELMKLLPLVFYLLVFEPEGDRIKAAAITIALAFATFENVCYLIQNGADRFSFIFFRGFGTGAMHVLCGLIVGGGLAYTWQRTWLKIAGTCGLLGAAITLHAIYNLLIAYGGAAQYIAYALPVLLVAAGKLSAAPHVFIDGVNIETVSYTHLLSTCEYSRNNSRLVVVAKRIVEGGDADAAQTYAEASAECQRPD